MKAVDRSLLERVARQAMVDCGFEPEFPAGAEREAAELPAGGPPPADVRDLQGLPWSSIDNPESQDLDQIEAVAVESGGTRLYVGIADVAGFVAAGSAMDTRSAANTTSVYTGVHTFPMLPDRLSSGLTSLLPNESRRALVIEVLVDAAGQLGQTAVYPAMVLNQAKLSYPEVSAWLDGGPVPAAMASLPAVQQQVRDQQAVADTLAESRRRAGAIELQTAEVRPVLDQQGSVTGLQAQQQDRAGALIEELMIAANRALVEALDAAGLPSLLRVLRPPERWDEITAFAAARGVALPAQPDSLALSGFVNRMRRERPEEFHEISLALVKLMGRGEYVAHRPGDPPIGHFGLAAGEYGHATAPNRRYADLVTQRLLSRITGLGHATPSFEDLSQIATRCTLMESQARKVERRVHKSIGAAMVDERIGERFQGVVTKIKGAEAFIHVLQPPLDGLLLSGSAGLHVGQCVSARLVSVDVERSYIDFAL